MPKVFIIILNWNGRDDTLVCLDSVRKLDYPDYHVAVVDNGSTDDSVKAIQACYPPAVWLTLIRNDQNLGYTGGTFSATASYYRTRNWIYFTRKHAAVYHWVAFIPLFAYVFMRRFLKALLRGDVPVIKSLMQAIAWNFKKKTAAAQ